jgi:hypothetical protein
MSLSLFKHGSKIMSTCVILSKMNQHEQQYQFKLLHIVTINKIKYVLDDDIKF